MLIDNLPIPESVVEAFCGLVDGIAEKNLIELIPEFLPGHQKKRQNVKHVRKRIKTTFRRDHNPKPTITALLRSVGLTRELVVVMSERALEVGFEDMARYFGKPDFIAAALLDEREEVRRLAHNFIANWDESASADDVREESAASLRSEFAPFIQHISLLSDEELLPIPRREEAQGALAKDKAEIEALKAAKADSDREIKKTNKKLKGVESKLAKAEVENERLSVENVTIREKRAVDSTRLAEKEREITELGASMTQRIAEGVDDALADRVREWVLPVRSVEDGNTRANQSEILGRATDALARQRTIDRKFGNRAELTTKVEERRQLLALVRSAQIEALNPLPELADIAEELNQELRSLESALGVSDENPNASVLGLLAKINQARTLDELSKIRRFMGRAASYDLLDGESREQLYRSLNSKVGLIYDQATVANENDLAASSETGFFLHHAAAKGEAFTLFLDGHNVLYRLKDIFDPYYEDGHPGLKARDELAHRLRRLFDKPGQNVLLFFDADKRTEESLSDQVRVIYSGGTGAHRADKAILEQMFAYKEMGKTDTICLVSRDADFEHDASELGAVILDPEEFAVSFDLGSA